MSSSNYCLIVPCYNHESFVEKTLSRLEPYQLHCIVVDDGSEKEAQEIIEEACSERSWVTLVKRPENGGKGAAVKDGFLKAQVKGFTHALQIDADCQHNVEDIPKFIELSKESPEAIIMGQAVYDESVPKSRLYGRYITHFWVMLETLSCKVIDTMCGFRIYPLEQLKKINLNSIGSRMDFDVEIAVKAKWAGIPSRLISTQVVYPENGISNFHYLKGNLRISWMHTKLCLGMLIRLPLLLWRKVFK